MSPWVKRVFIHIMPRLLLMRRPQYDPRERYIRSNSEQYIDGLGEGDVCDPYNDPFVEFRGGERRGFNGNGGNGGGGGGGGGVGVGGGGGGVGVGVGVGGGGGGGGGGNGFKFNDDFLTSHSAGKCDLGGCHLHNQRTYSPEIQKAIEGVQYIAQHIKDADRDNEECEDWKFVATVLDRLFLYVFLLLNIFGLVIFFRAPSLYDQRPSIDNELSLITLVSTRRYE